MYINKLLPAIMEKWPAWEDRVIKIQLDNAPVHPRPGRLGERLSQHLAQLRDEAGWNIDFVAQPANSPDTNTLDLAFFRAIQTLQYSKPAKNLDELIANVEEAYAELPIDVCRHVWSTAQIIMNSILLSAGGNEYKLPHIGKMRIARALGEDFPTRLPCQALIAGANINEAGITAFVAVATEEANGKLACPRVVLSSPPFNLRCLNNFVDCCVVAVAVAAAAAAHLDLIEAEEQEQLIVEFEVQLSLAGSNAPASDGSNADAKRGGTDNAHNYRNDAASESSMDGLFRMGRQLHRLNVLEDIFNNFVGEVEWGNEDYNHNPEVEDDGQYAPNE
jgi:hypothetical protein